QQRLPDYMIPARFITLDRFPTTPTRKIDRNALPRPDTTLDYLRNGDHGIQPDGEPRDALEAQLMVRWQEVLGRPDVGIHDDFFDLGGYSLLATRLFGLVEQDTGQRLPVSALFEAPTIAELAGLIRAGQVPTEWASLIPIQSRGSQLPFFYVAPYMISVLQLAHLGVELGEDQPLYGLQPQGLDGTRPIHTRVEEMAEAYIREIKTVQPRGPYRIGGHCAGSWVAFEMARQLEAAGDELDAVVLVDQGPPGIPQTVRWASYLMFRLRFYFRDGRLRHATAWQLKIALDRLRIRRRWNPALEHVQRVREVHRAALRDYEGGPVDADLVLVRSEESVALADKNWHTEWRTFTRGRFHERYAIGTHANLLEEPYVVVLADRIRWAFTRPR
ncbi:MAG TPA: thioesterase domain-containing protein, partial [Acidimicrobiales bacterium]